MHFKNTTVCSKMPNPLLIVEKRDTEECGNFALLCEAFPKESQRIAENLHSTSKNI